MNACSRPKAFSGVTGAVCSWGNSHWGSPPGFGVVYRLPIIPEVSCPITYLAPDNIGIYNDRPLPNPLILASEGDLLPCSSA